MPRTLDWSPKANGTTRLVIREEPETPPIDYTTQRLLSGAMQAQGARCPCCGQVVGMGGVTIAGYVTTTGYATFPYQHDAVNAYLSRHSNMNVFSAFRALFGRPG